MPDETLQIAQKLPTEFDRRAFFTKIGLGSLGIAAAGTIVFSYEFLSPNVLYEPSAIVNAGKPENFAVEFGDHGRQFRNLPGSRRRRILCTQ